MSTRGTAFEERMALLRRQLKWAAEKTEFYRTACARAGIDCADPHTAMDIDRVPLWNPAAQKGAGAPFFMLALPLSGLLRMSVLHDTADDRGHVHFYTQGDTAHLVRAAVQMLAAAHVNRASMVLLAGDFTDSRILDLQYALDAIGALTLPLDTHAAGDAALLLQAAVPDTVIAWQRDIPMLAPLLRAAEINAQRLITVGRGLTPSEAARRCAAEMGARHTHLFTHAALGALMGASCGEEAGIHIEEHLFFAEVIDAAGRSHVENGAVGELAFSTLQAEAMPVLRCRTGIPARLSRRACGCGNRALYLTEG